MSEQDRPSPPPSGAPFHPDEAGGSGAGIDRRVLYGCGIGCLVIGGLVVLVLGAFVLRGASVLRWALLVSEDVLAEAAPEDWSDTDRRRLEQAALQAATAVEEGRADPEALDELRRRLMTCLRRARAGELDRRDLEGLIDALETVDREEEASPARSRPPLRRASLQYP